MLTRSKVKEISLLLTPENRQAVRSGIKTQTRRIIKPQVGEMTGMECSRGGNVWQRCYNNGQSDRFPNGLLEIANIKCPYGKKGDRFYLLEPTQVLDIVYEGDSATVQYLDGGPPRNVSITPEDLQKLKARKDWTKPCSNRFMLKSFARYWFVNDGVRVQRLQEISEEDAISEGVEKDGDGWKCYGDCPDHKDGYDKRTSATASFMSLWDSINKDRGYSWDSNPWVWCISFKKAEL